MNAIDQLARAVEITKLREENKIIAGELARLREDCADIPLTEKLADRLLTVMDLLENAERMVDLYKRLWEESMSRLEAQRNEEKPFIGKTD